MPLPMLVLTLLVSADTRLAPVGRSAGCVVTGPMAQEARTWVAALRTSGELDVRRFRRRYELKALPDRAVRMMSDSATCAAAVAAYDAERRARHPEYHAKPIAERELYVVQMGSSEHAVVDLDRSLMAGEFHHLYWFRKSFRKFIVATTF